MFSGTRIQGDMNGWMDFNDPLDDTLTYNASGLVEMMATKAGSIWGGYLTPVGWTTVLILSFINHFQMRPKHSVEQVCIRS